MCYAAVLIVLVQFLSSWNEKDPASPKASTYTKTAYFHSQQHQAKDLVHAKKHLLPFKVRKQTQVFLALADSRISNTENYWHQLLSIRGYSSVYHPLTRMLLFPNHYFW